MEKPWKLILLLAGIFLSGTLAGGLVGVNFGKKARRPGPQPDQWQTQRLSVLEERLGLTPEQVEKVKPILRHNFADLKKIRDDTLAASRTVIERMEHDVAEQLTPEQQEKYEQLKKESRERFRRMIPDRERAPGKGGEPRERRPRAGDAPAEPPSSRKATDRT